MPFFQYTKVNKGLSSASIVSDRIHLTKCVILVQVSLFCLGMPVCDTVCHIVFANRANGVK